jgi:hypothetical protein
MINKRLLNIDSHKWLPVLVVMLLSGTLLAQQIGTKVADNRFITSELTVEDAFDPQSVQTPLARVEVGGATFFADQRSTLQRFFCGTFTSVVGQQNQTKDAKKVGVTLKDARSIVSPSKDSGYQKFYDVRFLHQGDYINLCYEVIPFRYSNGDRCSVEHILSLMKHFGDDVAVFMDSGGPHSIAMAAELVARKGYEAVWKIGSILYPNASIPIQQEIGALKYHANSFIHTEPSKNSPPVIIMDTHRDDSPICAEQKLRRFDNSAVFQEKEYPSSNDLKKVGVRNIIWITEGSTDAAPREMSAERLNEFTTHYSGKRRYHDPVTSLQAYAKSGLKSYQLRIDPYDCPYSQRHLLD